MIEKLEWLHNTSSKTPSKETSNNRFKINQLVDAVNTGDDILQALTLVSQRCDADNIVLTRLNERIDDLNERHKLLYDKIIELEKLHAESWVKPVDTITACSGCEQPMTMGGIYVREGTGTRFWRCHYCLDMTILGNAP